MTRLLQTLVIALLILVGRIPEASAQAPGRVRGTVADDSGGVLPGVTVTIAAAGGQRIDIVTNAVGGFSAEVPAGAVRLTFFLEGFAPVAVDVTVKGGTDLLLPLQRLELAPQSETIVVQGHVPPPPPEPAPKPAPPPAPKVAPVVAHDRDSVCGPAKPDGTLESVGVVRALRYIAGPELFAAPDQVVIDGGTLAGLVPGQNVVARRTFRVSGDANGMIGEHGAGLLQIVEATDRTAAAVIIYACDEILTGDRLTLFTPTPVSQPEPFGVPAWDYAARILFADSGHLIGAPRRLLVIDRGVTEDVRVGQRLTLFRRDRRTHDHTVVLGDAVVVAVRQESATIRVERAIDAIEPGDWAAPHRVAERAPTAPTVAAVR